ncbi:unnamed protein product [Rhizoctonia solani]|uniref:NACHT domain-containing protein n=1 Tax=Rhizoctonia solani TaxID=456999 RepID=A0A8H3EB02_9AGAM|nr:unnamed protein product [Rhizoctonia solani]
MATELTIIIQSLEQYTDGSSLILMSDSTTRIFMAIKKQVNEIGERMRQGSTGNTQGSQLDEDLVNHYRQIQSHFRRLKIGASLSAGSIEDESLMNMRFEALNPSKQAPYDSSLSVQISRRLCTEGTRIGVLEALDSWIFDPTSPSIYWMNGMAGTGKTTIASTFCERADRYKALAASFFCTRSSAECRDVTRIVPTIAYQLARYSIPFQSVLCKILGQNPDIGSKNVLKQFEQLLKEPLQQVKDAMPDHLVVVIDALDECDGHNEVELLLDILSHHAVHVPLKFLITSRPESEIYGKLSAYTQSQKTIHLHDIESSLVRADIKLYLKEELGTMFPGPEIEQLAQHSGTLFIYAATLYLT